jgi:hypothetical protein
LNKLIEKIDNGESLNNEDYKLITKSTSTIRDSPASYRQGKENIMRMVGQHGNFHIFRTQS